MAKLIVQSGIDEGNEWNLSEGETSVGRQRGNTLLLTDPKVSRRHFSIVVEGDRTVLVNRSKTSGTYVNGMRVDDELQIDDRDRITAGDTILTYIQSDQSAARHRFGESPSTSGGSHEISVDGPVTEGREDFEAVADPMNQSISDLPAGSPEAERIKKTYERLVLIQEIGKQLVSELDLEDLFELVLKKVFDLIRVDTGAVLLFNAGKRQVIPVAVRNRTGKVTAEYLNVSRSMVQFAVQNRVGVLSSDTQSDERFQEEMSVIARGIRSAMCVPMLYGEEILGIIYIDNNLTDYLFTRGDLDLLTILANQAAVAVRNAKLCERIVAEETQKTNLSRYLDPQLVEKIANDEVEFGLGGQQVETAILFSDIRGFTALSEAMTPAQVVTMLNHYFSEMTEIIFEFRGTLDKYVGDAVIAAFGSPVADEDACLNSLRCAALMQARLRDITLEGPTFAIGIGLHFGEVIHGNVGSEKIMQYTVIGDTVNTASRLCGLAPGGKIIMSKAFVAKLSRTVELNTLEPAKLKGKAEPMEIFEFAGEFESLVESPEQTAATRSSPG